ncbi:MAG: Asp-tRNA(Asn)/Glu-tRNA(Gln) amidotransferase subunit GatB [Nanoarchaeota archaeon]|nr:Asp-tRNA(Asn)/Glu-tRNA(Gln) amidotransferase subunit GatB [Nanoarchaeota archaeon]
MKFTRDTIIGLEIHVGLDTTTKLFCGCPVKGDDEPNSRTCEVCLGMPGSKPVLNKKAVDFGLKIALALNCTISPKLIFSRKSYFYPDLAKNYQITQYELPLGENGYVELSDGKRVRITRVHLEEDPASLVHPGSITESKYVLVDYNRSGNPLCEIVTEPDVDSPEQAREFMKALLNILNYLEVFDINICVIKADCNLSIKESGYVRSEIKNVTGFKEIERALLSEIERQRQAVEDHEKLMQDTRGWNPDIGATFRLRTKETEEDYGYILDPDLVVTELSKEHIKSVRASLPELPKAKAEKFVKMYKIKTDDARILAAEKSLAELFESVAEEIDPLMAVRWLRHELNKFLNLKNKTFSEIEEDGSHITELLQLVAKKKITDSTARELLERLVEKPFSPSEYVAKQGLESVSDTGELKTFCKKAVKENPQAVADYHSGKEKALNFLMGKVMILTKGKASPDEVVRILKELLKKTAK